MEITPEKLYQEIWDDSDAEFKYKTEEIVGHIKDKIGYVLKNDGAGTYAQIKIYDGVLAPIQRWYLKNLFVGFQISFTTEFSYSLEKEIEIITMRL